MNPSKADIDQVALDATRLNAEKNLTEKQKRRLALTSQDFFDQGINHCVFDKQLPFN